MSERLSILTAIRRIYEARESGDAAAVGALMHPNVQFKIVGDPAFCGACMTFDGREATLGGIAKLIEAFTFEGLEMLESAVEGGRAAVHWRATLTHRTTGEMFKTELLDLWTVGPDGLITALSQFCDTALVSHYMARSGA